MKKPNTSRRKFIHAMGSALGVAAIASPVESLKSLGAIKSKTKEMASSTYAKRGAVSGKIDLKSRGTLQLVKVVTRPANSHLLPLDRKLV